MAKWTVIVKNSSGSTQIIEELGIELLNGTQVTLSDFFTYDEIGGATALRSMITAGNLVVNDGTSDLSAVNGANFIQLENIYSVDEDHYTKTELSGSGAGGAVHWDNVTNAPAFGSPSWIEPAEYRVVDISASAPGSPSLNDVYVDTDDNHYYKYDGSVWQDQGQASTDDRVINLTDATQDVYTFNGVTWDDGGTEGDNSAIMIDDDGDGKNAQYVYSTESNVWIKIGDVDFGSHLDGGSNKHDASEVDVEGNYTNITSAPTDLETVIAEIDGLFTAVGGSNTLDEAYDEGGAGAGRVITADTGAVVINTASATTAPLELTPKAALPTTGLQDGQLAIKDGILCIYDSTRTKWLSVQRQFLVFGRKGNSQNQYLNFGAGSLVSNNSGLRMVRNACIVSVSGQLDVSGTCDMHVRRNDTATNISTLTLTTTTGAGNTSINIDLLSGDYLQSFISAGSSVNDPMFIIEIAWRL